MTIIKLTPEQVLEVSAIDHNNVYKNGQRAKDKKTYSRFKFEGKVFAVPSDNPFVQAYNDGQVKTIKLMQGSRDVVSVDDKGVEISTETPTLEFDSFVSRAQYNAIQADRVLDAGVEFKIARYQHLATAPVTMDLLNELESA